MIMNKKFKILNMTVNEIKEHQEKKLLLGGLMAQLQQPMKDVLNLQIAKQIRDCENLLKSVRK